jgi:hypothetical protein
MPSELAGIVRAGKIDQEPVASTVAALDKAAAASIARSSDGEDDDEISVVLNMNL